MNIYFTANANNIGNHCFNCLRFLLWLNHFRLIQICLCKNAHTHSLIGIPQKQRLKNQNKTIDFWYMVVNHTHCTCTKSHICTFILLSFFLIHFIYSFVHSFVHLIISFESFVFVFFPAFYCFVFIFVHSQNAHLNLIFWARSIYFSLTF